jgi:hypothetical protein
MRGSQICGFVSAFFAVILIGCGSGSAPSGSQKAQSAPPPAAHVKITQFYSPDPLIPRGIPGKLCYGVENASKLELSPPAGEVWPSPARCFDISPKKKTTYTLTAYGEDGSKDEKTVMVNIGAAPPKLYDLSVNSTSVKAGDPVVVCFKADNARSIKAGPGHLDRERNCLTDNPHHTTTYKIVALGADNEQDSGAVTVHVR